MRLKGIQRWVIIMYGRAYIHMLVAYKEKEKIYIIWVIYISITPRKEYMADAYNNTYKIQ